MPVSALMSFDNIFNTFTQVFIISLDKEVSFKTFSLNHHRPINKLVLFLIEHFLCFVKCILSEAKSRNYRCASTDALYDLNQALRSYYFPSYRITGCQERRSKKEGSTD